MHLLRLTVPHCRNVCVLALVLAAMLPTIGVWQAHADDASYGMMFQVPDVPVDFGKSGTGGWGALVLTFSGPIASATFVFNPACPTPLFGMIDPTSNNQTVQLGPGAYGLGPTGGTISKPATIGGNPNPYIGQQDGGFWVVVDYNNDDPPHGNRSFLAIQAHVRRQPRLCHLGRRVGHWRRARHDRERETANGGGARTVDVLALCRRPGGVG